MWAGFRNGEMWGKVFTMEKTVWQKQKRGMKISVIAQEMMTNPVFRLSRVPDGG